MIDGNAPAFPQHGWTKSPEIIERMQAQQGMTIRTAIAKDMLAAIIGSKDAMETLDDEAESKPHAMALAADLAVEFADFLLAALEK